MWQEITTYIIIAATTAYALYHTYKFFTYTPAKRGCGPACGGCSCSVKDVKMNKAIAIEGKVKNYRTTA